MYNFQILRLPMKALFRIRMQKYTSLLQYDIINEFWFSEYNYEAALISDSKWFNSVRRLMQLIAFTEVPTKS